MKCLVCEKEFVVKRYFCDLFSMKKYFVCDKCIKTYPINIQFNYIPLKNHQLEIVSIFDNPYVNYEGFISEYSGIYQKIIELRKESNVLLYDSFRLKEKTLEEFEILAENEDQDIIVLTNTYSD